MRVVETASGSKSCDIRTWICLGIPVARGRGDWEPHCTADTMDAFKKLFDLDEKKTDKKFKKAGEGHRLDEGMAARSEPLHVTRPLKSRKRHSKHFEPRGARVIDPEGRPLEQLSACLFY